MSFVLFHTHLVACSYSIYSDVHKHNTPLAEYHTRIGLHHYKLTCYISSSVTVQYVSLRHCCMQKNQPRPSSNFEFGWLGRASGYTFWLKRKKFQRMEKFLCHKILPEMLGSSKCRLFRLKYSVVDEFTVWCNRAVEKLYVRSVYSNRFEIECTGTFDFPCPLHLLLFPRPLLIDFRWNFLQSGM